MGCVNKMRFQLTLYILASLVISPCVAIENEYPVNYPSLTVPHGEVLIDNEFVVVQRFILAPGDWEGIHSHPGNQYYVHIQGGEWSERRGGEQLPPSDFSPTGSGGWMEPVPFSVGHESGNTGDTTIDLVWVSLKHDVPLNPEVKTVGQYYPNLDIDLVFENELVIVQRVQIEPGEWEGVHSHPGNQVYIHIKGGIWSERRGGEQLPASPFTPDGQAGWSDAVDMSVQHESGNTGDTSIDLVWVTLK